MECNDASIPVDDNNFISKVYKILREEYGFEKGVRVRLIKKIPAEAGLGGGSSNAAAFLSGIEELYSLNLSFRQKQNILKRVSADAPFFLKDSSVVAEGIGDKFVADLNVPPLPILLIKPPYGVSTKLAYANLNLRLTRQPRITNIHSLSDFNVLISNMYNDLEEAVFKDYEELEMLKYRLEKNGAVKALMTGSGSTVFGVFDSKKKLECAYKFFKKTYKNYFVFKTNTL